MNPRVLLYNENTESKLSKLEQLSIQHSCFEQIAISLLLGDEKKKKLGEQVNKKLLYRESDWLDVGLVVQKARKQSGTALLQWGLIEF